MLERSDMSASAIAADVLQSTQPVLLRGLVRHWPLVQAALRSDADFCAYLRGFGADTRLGLWRGPPDIGGRFFYSDDLTGFNYRREVGSFGALLDELLAGTADALYLGSTELDSAFPGLRQHNDLPVLAGFDPLVSLWLGNQIQVAAHFDLPDNIACVVAGRRRFTLFPPEQVGNLYIGPLDLTPAGQPVSLVDLRRRLRMERWSGCCTASRCAPATRSSSRASGGMAWRRSSPSAPSSTSGGGSRPASWTRRSTR